MKKYFLIIIFAILSQINLFSQFNYIEVNNPRTEENHILITSVYKSTGGVLYIGTMLGGVFRSFDEGVTWEQISSPEDEVLVENVSKFFTNDDKFVVVFSGEVDERPNSFYYSVDSCKSWSYIIDYLTNIQKVQKVFMFSDNNVVLIEKFSHKLYLSKDSCKTWNEVSYFSGKNVSDFYYQNEKLFALINGKEVYYSTSSDLIDWQKLEISLPADNILKLAVTTDERLIIQSSDFQFYSQDRVNKEWKEIYLGVPEDSREYVYEIAPITKDFWLIRYNNYLDDWNTFETNCYNETTNSSEKIPVHWGANNFHLWNNTLYIVSIFELLKAEVVTGSSVELDLTNNYELNIEISKDVCRITSNKHNHFSYTIYNTLGTELLSGSISGNACNIPIYSFTQGIYFMKVLINDKVHIKKFVLVE